MAKLKYFHARVADGSDLLVSMVSVHDVIAGPSIARLPHTNNAILGLINVEGVVLPLLDLARLFVGTPIEVSPRSIALVLSGDKQGR